MKIKFKTIFALVFIVSIFSSCGEKGKSSSSTDIEVTIGKQVWMTKNLNVDTFRNGDLIPKVTSAEKWREAWLNKQPAWCYYNDDSTNDSKYGKLYNWYAVNDSRGLAPAGYHVPSHKECLLLYNYLGEIDESESGNSKEWKPTTEEEKTVGIKMKSSEGWDSHTDDVKGKNSSGFTGLPGGKRDSGSGSFYNTKGKNGYWWTATKNEGETSYGFTLTYTVSEASMKSYVGVNGDGYSVRCIKN
jgi:uncharacterized protein (TIGR02145 family)